MINVHRAVLVLDLGPLTLPIIGILHAVVNLVRAVG